MLVFLSLVVIPLGLFWAWPHSRAQQNEMAEVRDRHLLLARNVGAALQRYHRDVTATFDYFADVMLTGRGRRVLPSADILRNLHFRHLCLIDLRSGRRVMSLPGLVPAASGSIPDGVLETLKAVTDGGASEISGVHMSATGEPVLWVMRVLRGRAVLGVLDTTYIASLGRSITFGSGGHAVIVDRDGRVLAHPLSSWVREMRDLSAVPPVKRMLAGEVGVSTFHSPAFREDMIAGFAAVPGTGWGVMVPQPLSELRAKAWEVRLDTMWVFAFGILIAALVALRVAQLVVAPLRHVTIGARRMADGDCDVRLEAGGRLVPREISQLVKSFNAMAESVSEARASEAEARLRAERASDSKTEFLRTVAHELRSPLNAIMGFSELLAAEPHGPLGAAYRAYARDILTGGRHMQSLINDLLDLSRIEAGQFVIADEVFGIDEIVDRAARYVAAAARERAIAIRTAARAAPAVRGDERALFQALLNVVSNAVKYGSDGGHVTISAEIGEQGGLEIVVADDGPGIAEADLCRVMQPFQRVDSARNRHVHGSGLGLPIVKRLIELHGGEFALESEEGVGTRAILRLPASRVVTGDAGMASERGAAETVKAAA